MPGNKTFEECNCHAVRAAARHVSQYYDHFLARAGLRTSQFSILAKLKRKGPLTITELADDMAMDRTTLGRNILPLQRDGLIHSQAATGDRRAKQLRLSKEGERRLNLARKGWQEAQAQFEKIFGATRSAELRALLRAVMATEFTAPAQRSR